VEPASPASVTPPLLLLLPPPLLLLLLPPPLLLLLVPPESGSVAGFEGELLELQAAAARAAPNAVPSPTISLFLFTKDLQ
jgi:hypothetical protein